MRSKASRRAAPLLFIALAGCPECEPPPIPPAEIPGEPCASEQLAARVSAAGSAEERAGLMTYRYDAHVDDTQMRVELLGAGDAPLAALRVAQHFDHETLADGTLEAVLERGGEDRLRLTTGGRRFERQSYVVGAVLERSGAPALRVEARFQDARCYDEAAGRPACAGDLPLGEAPYVLPSCGLLIDDEVRAGRAPTLAALTYRVAADEAAAAPRAGAPAAPSSATPGA